MPQDAPPHRDEAGTGHCLPFTTKLVVASGPFQLPCVARTLQVYFWPVFSFSWGVQRVCFSPASTVASSLSPDAPCSMKRYGTLPDRLSGMLRTTSETCPGGTTAPPEGVCGAGSVSRLRIGA